MARPPNPEYMEAAEKNMPPPIEEAPMPPPEEAPPEEAPPGKQYQLTATAVQNLSENSAEAKKLEDAGIIEEVDSEGAPPEEASMPSPGALPEEMVD